MAVPVYDAISDKWQIFDREFKTQRKAVEWMNKIKFVRLLRGCAMQLGEVMDAALDLSQRYKDLGFDKGGVKPIDDNDLKEMDLTAVDIENLIKILDEFVAFCNSAPKEGEIVKRVTINKVRE